MYGIFGSFLKIYSFYIKIQFCHETNEIYNKKKINKIITVHGTFVKKIKIIKNSIYREMIKKKKRR
jgi:hypothetical protein